MRTAAIYAFGSLMLVGVMCGPVSGFADGLAAEVTNPPKNFQECVAVGGRILKSQPPQCVSSTGQRFVEELAAGSPQRGCKDLCGDGKCQEIVCMALGCPCPETAESCPKDCS